jgi:hypothetical protein
MIENIEKQINSPYYGKVEYDERGYPICAICSKSYKKILSHCVQKHGITAKEYKIMFGLDVGKGIAYEGTKEVLREKIKENYDLVVRENLLQGGKKTRFKDGGKGRPKNMLSEQTRRKLLFNIKNTPSHMTNIE